MFQLGIISDEVHSDFVEACSLISTWGLSHVELRTLWGKSILELSNEEIRRARMIVDDHGLLVSAIASPLFKSPLNEVSSGRSGDFALSGYDSFEKQMELLARTTELCGQFDTNLARAFSFWREDDPMAHLGAVSQRLAAAAEVARQGNIMLAVENEPACNVGNGEEMGLLFDELDKAGHLAVLENIGVLWDPGNAYYAGELNAYPDGYRAVAHRVVHVHLKDVYFDASGEPHCVPLGQGRVDFVQQLADLSKAGYSGCYVVEPHYIPQGRTMTDGARACVEAAKAAISQAIARLG